MSFKEYSRPNIIKEGDLVIAYLSRDNMTPLVINATKIYNNKYGAFRHQDMIGKEYGTKMASHTGKGFMHLLYPTPEIWTLVLPHRTQILYVADIAFITAYLDLKPGARVIESGTGSGSFAHSIARTIAPNGHLYTFEYHEERANAARREFEEHGLGDMITLECRDICKDGFGIEDRVHAVFLDLPAPWEAISAAKKAFKQRRIGKICCFSPCIEQVIRTCATLNENGFEDIKMFEVLIRNHDTRTTQLLTIEEAIASKAQIAKKRKRYDTDSKEDTIIATEIPIAEDEPSVLSVVEEKTVNNLLISKTQTETRGHTSYLTFANFSPVFEDQTLETELSSTA